MICSLGRGWRGSFSRRYLGGMPSEEDWASGCISSVGMLAIMCSRDGNIAFQLTQGS